MLQQKSTSSISGGVKCKHKFELDVTYGEYVCTKCLQIFGVQFINKNSEYASTKPKNKISLWNNSYDRQRWKNLGIEYLEGDYNEYLGDQIMLELAREVPAKFVWKDVYQVYRKYRLTDYWPGFGSYIEMKPKITPQVMFYIDKYLDTFATKYRIPFQYLMYKFVQMFEGDEAAMTIPLHRSRSWLLKTDIWWENFCRQEGFKYKDSKIFTITWDKQKILRLNHRKIKMSNYIHNTRDWSKNNKMNSKQTLIYDT